MSFKPFINDFLYYFLSVNHPILRYKFVEFCIFGMRIKSVFYGNMQKGAHPSNMNGIEYLQSDSIRNIIIILKCTVGPKQNF